MNQLSVLLSYSDAYQLTDSPLLTSFNEEPDGTIVLSWTDGEHEYHAEIPPNSIRKMTQKGNSLSVVDKQGHQISITLFKLTPFVPVLR